MSYCRREITIPVYSFWYHTLSFIFLLILWLDCDRDLFWCINIDLFNISSLFKITCIPITFPEYSFLFSWVFHVCLSGLAGLSACFNVNAIFQPYLRGNWSVKLGVCVCNCGHVSSSSFSTTLTNISRLTANLKKDSSHTSISCCVLTSVCISILPVLLFKVQWS